MPSATAACSGCARAAASSTPTPAATRPENTAPGAGSAPRPTENTRSVALLRTLRTQGLVLRLPWTVTVGDDFAVPERRRGAAAGSARATRRGAGPHPGGRRSSIRPSDRPSNYDALLLHDIVPGGTGYLAQLAAPEQLWDVMVRAWNVVRTCECRHEQRLACHRCLLPFVRSEADLSRVSRAAAERHLRETPGTRTTRRPKREPMGWSI